MTLTENYMTYFHITYIALLRLHWSCALHSDVLRDTLKAVKMSKMPSKKKSCFQITSVTQAAQVAASSNTDDTESLDDPDEPRTEDMSSSEIYDMFKAGDFEPETCDVSLSDESLHNEAETSGASAQDAPITNIPGSRNASVVHINPPVRSVSGSVSSQSSVASNAPSSIQTSSVSSSATVSSCSSRFRVIKIRPWHR